MFSSITGDRHRLLHPLLPPQRQQHYSLRDRSHNLQLPTRTSSLKDNNLLIRMLFEDITFTRSFFSMTILFYTIAHLKAGCLLFYLSIMNEIAQSVRHTDNISRTRKTYDFPQKTFALPRRHVDNKCFSVATAYVDLSQRPVDVVSVCHSVNTGFHCVAVGRHRLQELLQPLQSCQPPCTFDKQQLSDNEKIMTKVKGKGAKIFYSAVRENFTQKRSQI